MDLTANWPGRVAEIHVSAGDTVVVDQELLVIESMKMLTPVLSTVDGVVDEIPVAVDDFVDEGGVLVRITPA